MRIERDVKLDFDDVLIRPKRSTLPSRNNVTLERTFKFPHGAKSWTGIPIIASNMDGVGTLSMMRSLAQGGVMTALHKHYDIPCYKRISREYAFVTIGIRTEDEERLRAITRLKKPRFLCIDVANGYTEKAVAFVKQMRETYPTTVIMAGNVVTGEMTEELILSGA
ncbi:MAG: GMP reductase, partial [Parcubacteria group bacterium Gr01-1014_48]